MIKCLQPFMGVMRSLLPTTVLLFLSLTVFSQKSITGKVLDADGKPVAGATVAVKVTTVATSTAADGSYTINVPAGKTSLVVTTIGYEATELDVSSLGDKGNMDATLKKATSDLNEVVVTGYTAQRKKDIIGAVSVVSVKDMQTTPASNLAVHVARAGRRCNH